MGRRDYTMVWVALGAAALTTSSFFLPGWLLSQMLFSLARGTAVLGLMVLWRAGLVSLGGALYFGIGAYAVALLQRGLRIDDALLLIFLGASVAAVCGFALGFLLRRYRGIYFAMMNLAFSMVLYGAVVKSRALGSTDGFAISPPRFFGIHMSEAAHLKLALFMLCVAVAYALAYLVHHYWQSTLGAAGTAIRENEIRVEYLGYSVERAIHIKYVTSGFLGGAGGAFMALSLGQVDPDSMINWIASGELLFVMIVSGASGVVAPFVGSFLFELLRMYAMELAPLAWQFIVGLTLVLLILFLPNGISSIFDKISSRVRG
jgi:ABC-type branched-subunit amino acid transport system permease subunit